MNKNTSSSRKKNSFIEKFSENYFEDLLQAVILEESLKFHRSIKLGYAHLILPELEYLDSDKSLTTQSVSLTPPLYSIGVNGTSPVGIHKSASGSSIASAPTRSGLFNSSSQNDNSKILTKCIQCSRKVCPSRYASHLSNCMGRGRYSSRRALQRIEEQKKQDIDKDLSDEDEEELDDVNDEDYQISSHGSSGVSGTGGNSNRKQNSRNGSTLASTKSSRSVTLIDDSGGGSGGGGPNLSSEQASSSSNNLPPITKPELNTMWTI